MSSQCLRDSPLPILGCGEVLVVRRHTGEAGFHSIHFLNVCSGNVDIVA